MRTTKGKPPSIVQAKRIAHLWATGNPVPIALEAHDGGKPYVEPTNRVLIKQGWIHPTGTLGKFPSGSTYEEHVLSSKGLDALLTYLIAAKSA